MRVLVLGGTVFLGRHVAAAALARGHELTLFHRGRHGAELFAGEAEHVLGERGVTVVPDILANSGGVIASHLESAQDAHGLPWTEQETCDGVRRRLSNAFELVCDYAAGTGASMRESALCLAMDRVAIAHLTLGLYP